MPEIGGKYMESDGFSSGESESEEQFKKRIEISKKEKYFFLQN
jgi:hypothetical protein